MARGDRALAAARALATDTSMTRSDRLDALVDLSRHIDIYLGALDSLLYGAGPIRRITEKN